MSTADSGAEPKSLVLYACSGAADSGQIADLVARRLDEEDWGSLSCLSGVGAGLSGFLDYAKTADNIILDGCPVGCGRKMFEQQGLPFTEVVITTTAWSKAQLPQHRKSSTASRLQ